MKIFQLTLEIVNKDIPTLPGIYYFKNKLNNKYYIGLAINIRKRLRNHLYLIKKENLNYPIYEAIIKYGIKNFEYGIIGVFKTPQKSKEILKKKLDYLEIKYILEYNSYESGYNQTKGGDGGILGYKMSEKQKEHISANSKKIANDGRYNIFIYDIINKLEYLFHTCKEASLYFHINRDALYSSYKRGGIFLNLFIIRKTKEELYNSLTDYNLGIYNSGKFKSKYSLEEYKLFKNKYPTLSLPELAKIMGICKKTIYNYEHLL